MLFGKTEKHKYINKVQLYKISHKDKYMLNNKNAITDPK